MLEEKLKSLVFRKLLVWLAHNTIDECPGGG